ncbi:hypothetical protein GYN67_04770 [Lactococcus piscium]|uniref:hypothetical protein n=1 Tax=Pseudolactococcus carnosus TaxID=2749961 RepID=UPI001FB8C83B|nr:hypothetical protein [Lactococcus carnosus]MCJ1995992.1 hypothetical protein [Lactococcus carnosus]
MAVFKRDKLIDISKRSEGGALVKRLESEIKELDREVSVLESELGQQVRENEQLKQELKHSDKQPSSSQAQDEALAESNHQIEKLSSLIDQYELQIKHLQENEMVGMETVSLPSDSSTDYASDALIEENQQLKHEIELILTQTVDEQEQTIFNLQKQVAAFNDADKSETVTMLNEQLALQKEALLTSETALTSKSEELDVMKQEAACLLAANQTLEMTAQSDRQHISDLEKEVVALEEKAAQLEAFKSEHDNQYIEIDGENLSVEAVTGQISELQQHLTEKEAELSQETSKVATLASQLACEKETLATTIAEMTTDFKAKLGEYELSVTAYQEKNNAQNSHQKDLATQLKVTQETAEKLQLLTQQLAAEVADKSDLISDLNEKLTVMTDSYTDQNVTLQTELVVLRKELETSKSGASELMTTVDRLKAELDQKAAIFSEKESETLTLETTLRAEIAELEVIQSDISEQNVSLSMCLTSAEQNLAEERAKLMQVAEEMTALDNRLTSMGQEVSEVRESKEQQVSLLQSIITENKTLIVDMKAKFDQSEQATLTLAESKDQKIQELQEVIQKQYRQLAESNHQNMKLEADILEKESDNRQKLSEMMLTISKLKHDVIEEANQENARKRAKMRAEATALLTEIEGFKDKFIETIELDNL